jgi:hypothetical protein
VRQVGDEPGQLVLQLVAVHADGVARPSDPGPDGGGIEVHQGAAASAEQDVSLDLAVDQAVPHAEGVRGALPQPRLQELVQAHGHPREHEQEQQQLAEEAAHVRTGSR